MAARDEIEIAGVRLTSPDKVLYPEQGITKRDLANYMVAVADWMLPHVANRPITLVRCPTGRQKKCFYQRHAGSGVPTELGEIPVPGFEEPYLFVRDVRGLVALVQMGVLEVHPWGARNDNPERPDRMIFDLDPGEGLAFADVVAAAREVRAMLESIKLTSFLKTTGGKGLHLVVPIVRRYDWQQVKGFAKRAAEKLANEKPERYLIRMSKAERRGRILIDYLRNDPTSTAIAPYSTRSREGAPVATPLAWDELNDKLDPRAFNEKTVPGRLKALKSDPWADIGAVKQALPRKV
ncbi:MAG: non-homologous end-joining DNA ligase, partial [Methylobacteriaceae bacterium]|nr:non-homologous end-joining DNA ligase [Methylobacteriaceae bacterium]